MQNGRHFHFFNDTYETIEGYVVYDSLKQSELAKMALKVIVDIIIPSGHVVDICHVRKIIIMCIVLFKDRKYSEEEEYRISFIRKTTGANIDLNETRFNKEKEIKYIKAVIPHLHNEYIVGVKVGVKNCDKV